MQPSTESYLRFIKQQLELFRKQHSALDRSDHVAARTFADQLGSMLPGLIRAVKHSRKLLGSGNRVQIEQLEGMISEMRSLHKKSMLSLFKSKDNLAQLLRENKVGRQVLSGYRSGRRTGNKLFEFVG